MAFVKLSLGYVLALTMMACHVTPPPVVTPPIVVPPVVIVPPDPPQPPALSPAPDRTTVQNLPWRLEDAVPCHTDLFGDLVMFDPFYVSMNEADRQHWRDCHTRMGDQAVMIAFRAEYGEPGQPYGSGQLVPPTDFTGRANAYRAVAIETLRAGLYPLFYLGCDNGYQWCLDRLPQIQAALLPQPGAVPGSDEAYDFTHYELFLCFDSCIPGYQPPSQVYDLLEQTRAYFPNAVVSIEGSAGYATVDLPSFWTSAAGLALDKWYVEFPFWPETGDQVWQILGRLLPHYIRDPLQPADDDPRPPHYPQGTPRGEQVIGCMEKMMYLLDHAPGHYSETDVVNARAYYSQRGCDVVN